MKSAGRSCHWLGWTALGPLSPLILLFCCSVIVPAELVSSQQTAPDCLTVSVVVSVSVFQLLQSTRGAAAGLLKVAASCKVAAAAQDKFWPGRLQGRQCACAGLSRDAHQSGGDMKFQTRENWSFTNQ